MKIEIGESLILSYLKHIKKCVFYQTNWKTSSNWDVETEDTNKAQCIYNTIINHPEFRDIFKKSTLDQLIQQSEIDVLGMDSNNVIYAVDIAFHEAGLNYGDKIETKDRVFKKLLRSYLVLLTYFPNKKYELLFCSPKVNPTTENLIYDYFKILEDNFVDENVVFKYISNEKFNNEILKPTIEKSINDSDTNELFIRSIILDHMFEKSEAPINLAPDTSNNLTPSEAKKICITNGFNIDGNFTFASKNNAANTYWANPKIEFIEHDWRLLLNDWPKQRLHVFNIPANSIRNDQVIVRNTDRPLIELRIKYEDELFENSRSGIQFYRRKKKTILTDLYMEQGDGDLIL
jgi:hypothetical protein